MRIDAGEEWGGRDLTFDEQKSLDNGALSNEDLNRILDEPEVGVFHAPPQGPPPQPFVQPQPLVQPQQPVPQRPDFSEQNRQIQEQNRQIQEQLNQFTRDIHVARDNLRRQSNAYDRLFNWGMDLVPDYYSYSQKKRLEYLLENLIRSELNKQRSESELEDKIRNLLSNEGRERAAPVYKTTTRKAKSRATRGRTKSKAKSKTAKGKTKSKAKSKTAKGPKSKAKSKTAKAPKSKAKKSKDATVE